MHPGQDINDRVAKLAAQGHELATRQESGMSETPLSNLFNELRAGKRAQPVEIALVGLDPDSVPRVLAALLGQDYPLCRVVIPDRLGYSEIHLCEHGFLLEVGAERREFDLADDLMKAIELSRATGEAQSNLWSDPVRLSVQAPAGRSGVVLLVPDSLDSLTNKPALLSVIASRAGFLVIAGQSNHQLTQQAKLTLGNLVDALGGVQCVITDEAPAPAHALAETSWLKWPKSPYTVATHTLAEPASPPLLPFLDSASPLAVFKDYLCSQRNVNQVEEILGLLDESLQADLDQLANRLRLAESGASAGSAALAGSADLDSRPLGDDLRNRIQEDLDTIKKNREDAAKRAMLPGGELLTRLTEISDTLQVADIEQDRRDAVIKLSLSDNKLSEITEALQQEVKRGVLGDLAVIDETVDATREETQAQLESALGTRTRLHLDPIDRSAWWDSIVTLARPEIRYRAEMPVITFGKRFSEARGGLSLIMIAAGMLTGLQAFVSKETLQSLRTGLYSLMIPVLLGGLIWTFVSVRKRDRATLQKELDRLREGVLAELRKVAGELLRIQGTQIASLSGRISKQLNGQVADLLKKQDNTARNAREQEAQRARERNRGIEQRSREKSQQRSELSRLRSSVPDIRRMLNDWLRVLTTPATTAPALSVGSSMPAFAAAPPASWIPTVAPSPSRFVPPS